MLGRLVTVWNLLSLFNVDAITTNDKPPVIVVATWPFTNATDTAWSVLQGSTILGSEKVWGTAIAAVVAGCTSAEEDPDIHSVGYGNSPDEEGHTTLDAMVMDGKTMQVGAVAAMPDIREAAQVAFEVMRATKQTLLVGTKAADFAVSRGFTRRSSDTPESQAMWKEWLSDHCQPNYRIPTSWTPDPSKNCGPYRPRHEMSSPFLQAGLRPTDGVDYEKHDTIGMIAIDHHGSMAVGLSTSGLIHKLPGRVGDTPIPGAGGYVDNEVGGAVGTGDGDIMMRFLLSYQAVQLMRQGVGPTEACEKSLQMVRQDGQWSGALVALTRDGKFGSACRGFGTFHMSVRTNALGNESKVISVPCPSS